MAEQIKVLSREPRGDDAYQMWMDLGRPFGLTRYVFMTPMVVHEDGGWVVILAFRAPGVALRSLRVPEGSSVDAGDWAGHLITPRRLRFSAAGHPQELLCELQGYGSPVAI